MKNTLITLPFLAIAKLPLRCVRSIGRSLGSLAYLLNIELVKVTRKNLSLCYPDMGLEDIEQLCKKSIQHTFIFSLETCLVWKLDKHWLDEHISTISGEDILTTSLQHRRGTIILAPHIGNWEALGNKLSDYSSLVNLYAPPKNKSLEKFIVASREAHGHTLVPTNSRGIAKLLKHLKSGGITGILPDQVPPKSSGEYSEFFELTAYTMTLVHGLITRTGCKVLVAAAIRDGQGFRIHFLEPDERIYSEELSTSLLGLNKSVEKVVALAPEQYQWEYKRFKRQPSKAVSYYDF